MAQSPGGGRTESPQSPQQHDPWKHHHVIVNNTFINISPPLSETATGWVQVRRQISDPTSSRSSSLSSSQSHSGDPRQASADVRRNACRGARSSRDRHQPDSSDSDDGKCSGSSARGATKGAKEYKQKEPELSPLDRAALHERGQCKPCAFHSTESGCVLADECRFCHFPHKVTGKIRLRPCKGKRMRTKKMFNRLGEQVAADPDGFDPEKLDLPPSLEQNTVLKSRLIGHLLDCADQARAGRSSASEGEGDAPTRPRGSDRSSADA